MVVAVICGAIAVNGAVAFECVVVVVVWCC